ncbi:MAG: YozE family protein [Burkholderiales bacterium]
MSKNYNKSTRYYVHGDASEDNSLQFYCASCDVFVTVDHFEDEQHVATRAARYEQSLKEWRGLSRNYIGEYHRPKDAVNWLTDEVAADKRKIKAARGNFYTWLLKQANRDDPIGDLSNDSKRDSSFPVSITSGERLRSHLRQKNACDEALVALDEALREFRSKSKNREGMSLTLRFQVFRKDKYRCQLCGGSAQDGKRLEVDHKLAVARGGTNELENLWTLCFECNRGKQAHYM